jgi:hypothetical protein
VQFLKKTRAITLILFIIRLSAAYAQVDTISIKKNNLQTGYLKAGNNQYVSWSQDAVTKKVSRLLFWERRVIFGKKYGRDVIIVAQQRLYEDTSLNTFVYTVSDSKTFQTIYDYRMRKSAGIQAFNYNGNTIKAADTIKNNIKAGFSLTFGDIPYCFELDLETLSMLPITHVGQQLAVNFYHPGGSVAPAYYPVKVLRDEQIPVVNGVKIDCWVIKLSYDKDDYDYSWISKTNHEFLKLESHSPQGTYNKVKLLTSLTNI